MSCCMLGPQHHLVRPPPPLPSFKTIVAWFESPYLQKTIKTKWCLNKSTHCLLCTLYCTTYALPPCSALVLIFAMCSRDLLFVQVLVMRGDPAEGISLLLDLYSSLLYNQSITFWRLSSQKFAHRLSVCAGRNNLLHSKKQQPLMVVRVTVMYENGGHRVTVEFLKMFFLP